MTHEEIDHDLRCARCGYNLHGLPRDSRCPECAEPISTSLAAFRPDRPFSAGDARWLRLMALVPALVLLAVALWTPLVQRWYIVTPLTPYPALILLMFLSPLVSWLAAWNLAHARPQPSHSGGGGRANILRTAATVTMAIFYLRLFILRGGFSTSVLIIYVAGVLVSSVLLHRMLADVLGRVPSSRLARWHRWAGWAVPALLLLHLAGYARSLGLHLSSHRYWEHLPTMGWGPISNLGFLWWDLIHLSPARLRWWSAAGLMLRTVALPPLLIASTVTLWRAANAARSRASSRP